MQGAKTKSGKQQADYHRPSPISQNLFSYERFRFSLKVTSLMVLPPYKGGVFRGAFGSAFRGVVCAIRRAECKECLLRNQCLYVAFFEPPAPPDHPHAAKFNQAPSPFVLNPPLTNRQAFHPEDVLNFELVLIGRAIEALPYFAYTFIELGHRGLGRERGKYELIRVDLLRDNKATQVYDGTTQTLRAYPPKEKTESHAEDNRVNSLTLEFLTPLRLKVTGDLVTQLTFPLFFERLSHRLTLLSAFYGSNGEIPNLPHLMDQAQEIKITDDGLHWYDWERYSGRQKTAMKLGGLKGVINLEGNLSPFMPYLRLGEQVNVGQGTSFGLGRYEMVMESTLELKQ